MPLCDVSQLVAQHSGQLVPAADSPNQAQMHAQKAARQCKRIDGAVTDQKQLPGKALVQLGTQFASRPRSRHQGLPDGLQVVRQHHVVNVVRVAVNTGGNAVANAALGRSGQLGVVAQRRQSA